jgi:sulfite exporter TauE/SafE
MLLNEFFMYYFVIGMFITMLMVAMSESEVSIYDQLLFFVLSPLLLFLFILKLLWDGYEIIKDNIKNTFGNWF